MAEAERYLPRLIDKIEEIVEENGLSDKEITIRMTGCPNGCARHALGEIGFIGKSPGKYNMYLGAAFDGSRLSKVYTAENVSEAEHFKRTWLSSSPLCKRTRRRRTFR